MSRVIEEIKECMDELQEVRRTTETARQPSFEGSSQIIHSDQIKDRKMAQQSAAIPAPQATLKINWVKVLGVIATFVVFFVVWNMPLEGVSPQGRGALALLAACVVAWITQPMPMVWTAVIAMFIAPVLGYVKLETALSGFSGSTFWLLFAACGMGACIAASGLAKRIALTVLAGIGRPTFKRVLAGVYVALFVLGFFIPSVLAKSIAVLAVFIPLVSMFGVPLTSRISKAIVLSIVILGYVGSGVLPTAGVNAVLVYGGLTQAGYQVNFLEWAVFAIPPIILIFLATYFFMLRYAKPEVDEVAGGREGIKKEIQSMPKMGKVEIWALIVTLSILVLWIVDPYMIKIGAAPIGVIGVMLYLLPSIGSMKVSDFLAKAIPWEILIMVGAVIGISAMVPATGVAPVIGNMLVPILSMANSPFGLAITCLVLNLIQWPLMIIVPTIPLVIKPLVEAAAALGLSPSIAGVFYLVFFPQFFFWAFAPFTALAFKDGAANLKDWLIVSAFVFAVTVVVFLLAALIWVPVVARMGLS
jgi:solute carrier family 13 (sodium-dependent dicarboxylate transporter), member 2/3/5